MTVQMKSKSEKELWDDVVEIEQQRRQLITVIFPLDDAGNTPEFRALLAKLIESNTQLEQYCKQQKQTLQLELQGMNKNKKALNAYRTS